MNRLVFLLSVLGLVVVLSVISVYLRLKPSVPGQVLILENFEPGQLSSRNSGTWIKRDGKIYADRVAFADVNTVLRLTYDVQEDGDTHKEAGWWCSLSAMDLRNYRALRFRVSLSDHRLLFLIGFKNAEWLEQKAWSESFTKRSVPAGQWQEVTIPLSAFHRMDNWSVMDNFSIAFRSDVGNVSRGEVLVDDFQLIPSETPAFIAPPPPVVAPYPLPAKPHDLPQEPLLDLVQRAAFVYFINEVNPANGLVKDFCRVKTRDRLPIASTAATGFGLASLCVGASRGWISDDFAKERILACLRFFRDQAEEAHGFFYHFLDTQSGRRWEESELSSIDTALLLAGMLTAANYYPGTKIEKIAREIYRRVDWPWMMAGGKTMSMGWTPESGFLSARWSDYCELMIIYLLAIGSDSHPIGADSWYAWSRKETRYRGESFIACPPLFTHQYSHIFVDFRGIRDRVANYFKNSVRATRANRQWSKDERAKFRTYREGFWGLTASDGPTGYMAYGAPKGVDDGTVAPTAAIGSILFTPEASVQMIRDMLRKLPHRLWGRYGFIDAFNLENRWFSNKYIGIDQGPIVLMIENYRTGLVWKTFMKDPAVKKALKAAGFVRE